MLSLAVPARDSAAVLWELGRDLSYPAFNVFACGGWRQITGSDEWALFVMDASEIELSAAASALEVLTK